MQSLCVQLKLNIEASNTMVSESNSKLQSQLDTSDQVEQRYRCAVKTVCRSRIPADPTITTFIVTYGQVSTRVSELQSEVEMLRTEREESRRVLSELMCTLAEQRRC